MDLSVDLHAGDEAQLFALALEIVNAQVNKRAVGCFLR